MTYRSLLERARRGLVSSDEANQLTKELRSGGGGRDAYSVIHALGLAGAVEHEPVIASYLNSPGDPMLARIALQVLWSHWNRARAYKSQIERFARGVPWDKDNEVRLAAISIAGEMLRDDPDPALLGLLLELFREDTEDSMVRQEAYLALARAAGRDWKELPVASHLLNLRDDVDPAIEAWAQESVGDPPIAP